MTRNGFVRFMLSCLVVLAVPASAHAELVRAGSEFRVNTYILSFQRYPGVAVDDEGDFVVAWTSYGQDGSGRGVFARRFDSSGAALATEFQVNTYTSITQGYPSVAVDGAGNFVVVWTSSGQDGSSYGVFGRRFNSAGTALATEFLANSYTLGLQSGVGGQLSNGGPEVAADDNGGFVVVWHSAGQDGNGNGIFARRFDANGAAVAEEFMVNTYTSSSQAFPTLDLDANGDFVVTWQSLGQDADTIGVFARRFTSAGSPLAAEFQVNNRTFGAQRYPRVGLDDGGDFVIAWQSYGQDGMNDGIFARRFTSSGSSLSGDLQINTYTTNAQRFPSVVLDTDGDFVVAWSSFDQDGSLDGAFARRFNQFGVPLAGEFQVNTYTMLNQSGAYAGNNAPAGPAVGINDSGDFVVAWHSYGQDGAGGGVFAQRFDNVAVLDIDGNGDTAALTDGLLVLRFLFGFSGSTLTAGAVDLAGCQRCDATAIAAYLETLI
jgi:hypothetical protein